MRTKSRAAQLDRDIAHALQKPRHQHAVKQPDDEWLVARDAILALDPAQAAVIVNQIRATPDQPKPSRAFKKALHDAPSSVRTVFEARVPGWESKLGKIELTEKKPGVVEIYVPEHGYFDADVLVYNRYAKLPRKKLLAKVLQIYEGTRDKGDKAAHWKGYDKDYLAMIVASAYGE
jgi:hypothetical protein